MADDTEDREQSPCRDEDPEPRPTVDKASTRGGGLRRIVQRIQLAAEFNRRSKASHEEKDCLQANIDLGVPHFGRKSMRRKSRRVKRTSSFQIPFDGGTPRFSVSSQQSDKFTDELASSLNQKRYIEGEIKFAKEESNYEVNNWQCLMPTIVNYLLLSAQAICDN